MLKSVNIILKGKLYKSGFRFYILEQGVKLGVTGYVKYIDKRDIFIHAVATEDALNEFTRWCEKGKLSCKVESMEVIPTEVKEYAHFDIEQT